MFAAVQVRRFAPPQWFGVELQLPSIDKLSKIANHSYCSIVFHETFTGFQSGRQLPLFGIGIADGSGTSARADKLE
jgi:hypothetical protein